MNWKVVLVLILISSAFFCRAVFAYDDKTTHPALTDETIDFYNLNFNQKISDEEKEWIVSGSILEDTPPRWVNHFYDPIYKIGWTGEQGGLNPQDILRQFTDLFLSNDSAVSALNWLHNQELQAKYKLYYGNQTWEKAIYEYVKNKNKKEAYFALGYVLHLLEDMAVPDHTRNDTHPNDSPYENYSTRFTRDSWQIADKLQNKKPIAFNSLDEYFEYLADYSNNYFFSKDTINDTKYNKPKIIYDDGNYAYGVDENNSNFFLVKEKIIRKNDSSIDITYDLQDKDAYKPILYAYFTRLSREAVLSGAGVVDLFFKEAGKAEKDPTLLKIPPENKSAIISIVGEFFKINNFLKNSTISIWNRITGNKEQSSIIIQSLPNSAEVVPPPSQPAALAPSSAPPKSAVSAEVVPPQNLPATPKIAAPAAPPPPPPFIPSLPWPGFGGGSNPAEVVPPPSPTISDTTPPDISFSISECSNSSSSTACVLATTTLNLIWQTSADDLDYFELIQNGQTSITTATSTSIVITDNSVNNFSVRAKDKTGNWSNSATQTAEIYIPTFITNPSIDSNTTFVKARSPYVIDNILLTVQASATLTIEPGVVVKFRNDAGISVLGKIIVQGTIGQQIVFTSYLDDEYGGDANADATSTAPFSGDWYGIEVLSNGSIFDNAIFRYGGKWYNGAGNHMANLSIKDTNAPITNSIFEYSKVYGLKLSNSNSSVSNNIFRNNGVLDPAGYDGALTVIGGSPFVQSNIFQNNRRGIYAISPLAIIDSNSFTSNTREAIFSASAPATFTSNSGFGNAADGIFLSDNISQAGATTTLKVNSLAYIFDSAVNIPINSGFIVESGVNFKAGGGFFGGRLDVYGNFIAQGINPGDIVFTSSAIAPAAGDWQGIRIYGNSDIKGTTFKYADKAVAYYNSPIKLENTRFENNNLGVYADGAAAGQTIYGGQPISALLIEFISQIATTSPSGLW